MLTNDVNSLTTAPTSRNTSVHSQSSYTATDHRSHSSQSSSVVQPRSETSSVTEATSPAINSQESSYLRFECGCDQCSVYDYISGKICPNPKELDFPKIKVFDMPPEEMKRIEKGLSKRTKLLHFKFCSLVTDTFKDLKKNVDYTELISHLKICLSSPYESSASDTNMLDNINLFDIPKLLMDKCYCSWFDYS